MLRLIICMGENGVLLESQRAVVVIAYVTGEILLPLHALIRS